MAGQASQSTSISGPGDIRHGQPISRLLLEDGVLGTVPMLHAMAEAARLEQPVSRVLAAEGLVAPEHILGAEGERFGAIVLRADSHPPEERALAALPAAFCLEFSVLPWLYIGDTLVLATARPEAYAHLLTQLPPDIGPVMMAVTLEADIHQIIGARHGAALARRAETLRPAEDSCRDLANGSRRARWTAAALLLGLLALLAFEPLLFFGAALGITLASLFLAQMLKILSVLLTLRRPAAPPRVALPKAPPRVSVLVPLFREKAIATDLVKRLSRLTYPKALLDVVLILEAEDHGTRAALETADLPPWIRCIIVPPGEPMTKPRAMNYALHFTSGAIVGILDAEDSPAPDQIERVAAHFATASPDVACLQGILDYYNPHANWLSRCFAIEYASWFRVLLPGLSRLGFAVPLGGTTVYFRRDALLHLGGWDAHNVTEDADLGMLLARRGYRTELVRTVTREEANNRFWPWVKQRSRWLKGYAITWWVQSRRPVRLWRELGAWRFFGVQVLFLTTLVQFALAPVLWSFWLVLLGLPHPADALLSEAGRQALIAVFLSAEAISLTFGIIALSRSPHARLYPWVPTLLLYFPLGTLAIYKALWEVLRKPFYWDKTEHGLSAPDSPGADLPTGTP